MFDRIFLDGLQEVNSVLQNHHSSKTNEGKEKEQEGRERKGKNTTHSFSLSSLPLYSREHFSSAQLSSLHLKTQPTTNPSIQNVHNRRLLHSTSHLVFLPPPIPPPLHPLLPLLHHTNHYHLSHHPKTTTKPHLGRNFPLNSMDTSPFADGFTMHEQQQQ